MGETKNEKRRPKGRSLRAYKLETASLTDLNRGTLRRNRANEYAAPMHNARTTKPYSVSFPV